MSFIKDLIAWKARPERAADQDADDDRLLLGIDDDDDGDYGADWDDDIDSEAEADLADRDPADRQSMLDQAEFDDADLDDEDEDFHDEDPGAARADAAPAAVAPIQASAPSPRRATPPASHNHVDSVDVDDLLNRVAQRNAARATQADAAKVMRPATPPKIWELNVGPAAQPAARTPVAAAAPRPEAPIRAEAAPSVARPRPPTERPDRHPPAASAVAGPPTLPVQPETRAEPPSGPAVRPAGRVKTRLLGFHSPGVDSTDPFDSDRIAPATGSTKFPTGWVVVIDGPGRGTCFTLQGGVSQIGRGEGQAIRLDFGDQSVSRNNHAAIAYDDEVGRFYLGHGGKLNLVRLNDRPVLSTEELATNDKIRIGETVLKFVALCGDGFSWAEEPGRDANAIAG